MAASPMTVRNEASIVWTSPKTNARVSYGSRFSNAFLANSWRADVSFFLPKDKLTIPAHSVIVAAASPKLERLCFEADGSIPNGIISIVMPEDYTIDMFEIVLRFIYNEDVTVALTASSVKSVVKIASYLDLRELQGKCCAIIETGITIDNVCSVFEEFHLAVDLTIRQTCLKLMQENTEAILDNGSAMKMSDKAVCELLESDTLDISEESKLLTAMIEWADAECESRGFEINSSNRRLVLNPRLKCVRFAAMSIDEFVKSNRELGNLFFTNEEKGMLMQHIESKRQSNLIINGSPMSSTRRSRIIWTEFQMAIADYDDDVGPAPSTELNINVQSLGYPFRLTGIEFNAESTSNVWILNTITNELATGKHDDGNDLKFIFNKEITPDTKGRIHLQMYPKNGEKMYNHSIGTGNYISGGFTSVDYIIYKVPKNTMELENF